MDYIQEELRRQREALAGLLLGGAPRRDRDGGGNDGVPAASLKVPGGRSGAVTAGAGADPEPERTADRTAGAPAALSAGSGGRTGPGVPGTFPLPAGRPRAEKELSRGGGQAAPAVYGLREYGGPAGGASSALASDGLTALGPLEIQRSAGDAVSERTVTEFVPAERGGYRVEAESLSRAIQRDARRYDGGFSLY